MQRESFARAIKSLRETKGMSLEQVHKRSGTGLAASYISRIENGAVDPKAISVGTLESLAKGLGMSVEYLFELARDAEPELTDQQAELVYYSKTLTVFRRKDLLDIARLYYQGQLDATDADGTIWDVTTEMTPDKKPSRDAIERKVEKVGVLKEPAK